MRRCPAAPAGGWRPRRPGLVRTAGTYQCAVPSGVKERIIFQEPDGFPVCGRWSLSERRTGVERGYTADRAGDNEALQDPPLQSRRHRLRCPHRCPIPSSTSSRWNENLHDTRHRYGTVTKSVEDDAIITIPATLPPVRTRGQEDSWYERSYLPRTCGSDRAPPLLHTTIAAAVLPAVQPLQ